MLPVTAGVVTFGAITGVAMSAAGLPPLVAIAMSFLVFAGTAQLASIQMLASGTPVLVVLVACLIINLRFVVYSLSISPHLRPLDRPMKWFISYTLSDNSYAHAVTRFGYHRDEPGNAEQLAGACFIVWAAWQLGTVVGVLAGAGVPAEWSLEFSVALTFLALAVGTIRDSAMAAAAGAAGVTAVLAWHFPYRIGLILAIFAGVTAGYGAERLRAAA